MQVNFIGHGLDPDNENTVGNLLATSFQDPKFDTFFSLVAFASTSGVRLLMPFILDAKAKYKELVFYIGVDDNGTSKEALQQLIDNSVLAYIFHTQSAMIFHPKIYMFEGKNWTRLVIGSTNLTNSGLFVNVEAAVSMDFRPTDSQGKKIVTQIKDYFQTILEKSDKNLELLTKELLETLCKQGLVKDELQPRNTTPEQAEVFNELNLFPDRDQLNRKEIDLGTAELPDEIQAERNYDLQFTNSDLEKFPYFFEKWLQYKEDNHKTGGVVNRDTDDRALYSWFRKIKWLNSKQKEIPLQVMQQLQNNGFPFEDGKLIQRMIIWEERFSELVAYMKKYRMTYAHVPQHKNPKHPYHSLGQWCATQKVRRKG
ncbi:MAG: phospholipase D-like domain-containing protein, partial [Ginsengibacter sp.]